MMDASSTEQEPLAHQQPGGGSSGSGQGGTAGHAGSPPAGQPAPGSPTMLGLTLAIHPSSLEQRFWLRRCRGRLTSLDVLYELCNTLVWLSILPNLAGSDRAFGKASLLLAATQLSAIHLAPQLWLAHRSALLSAGMLLRCGMLLLQLQPGAPAASASPGSSSSSSSGSSGGSMVVAAGFWCNLLFVLFHQQPVRVQAPLLALSASLQAWCLLSAWPGGGAGGGGGHAGAPHSGGPGGGNGSGGALDAGGVGGWLLSLQSGGEARELLGLSRALGDGVQQLVAGLLGGAGPTGPPAWQPSGGSEAAALLTTKLFLVAFGGFVLPCFIAYCLEWKYKVAFLLSMCKAPDARLGVLTPAAAVVRSSALLAALLYAGWLLMLAVASWLLCSVLASALLAGAV